GTRPTSGPGRSSTNQPAGATAPSRTLAGSRQAEEPNRGARGSGTWGQPFYQGRVSEQHRTAVGLGWITRAQVGWEAAREPKCSGRNESGVPDSEYRVTLETS